MSVVIFITSELQQQLFQLLVCEMSKIRVKDAELYFQIRPERGKETETRK